MSATDGAESDFRAKMSYGDYLRLEEVLGAQAPITDAHDELLFIIQHQTSELWMKLAISEIRAACAASAKRTTCSRLSSCSRAWRASSSSSTAPGTCSGP